MAKEKKIKVEVENPQVKEAVLEKSIKPKKDKWQIKDRVYYLKGKRKPLTRTIKSGGFYHFDEDKGYEREIMYCPNQKTVFVDEMQGQKKREHIVFRAGVLFVPKNKVTLQKILSIYHPYKDTIYYEEKPELNATVQVDNIELELEALNAAQSLDIDMAEAVMRVEVGSKVSNMSSKELKRDLFIFAKRNPQLFLDVVNDENIQLRNFGIKATEMGIIKLSSDQRTFNWGSTGRKLMTVPFDEHPYSALAQWFKTDEGIEIYSNIEKRLK
tara:strand:+ start:5697 stop:6506 length:810 start_codon:yes stop_codon:yes gene_type:complete